MKLFWKILGHFFVLTGIIGAILPLLPTTPFLLLALWCYHKGAPEWEAWLLKHPKFGPLAQDWREGKGIPKRIKIIAISSMVVTMGLSGYFFTTLWFVRVLLVVIALGVSYYLIQLPTKKVPEKTF